MVKTRRYPQDAERHKARKPPCFPKGWVHPNAQVERSVVPGAVVVGGSDAEGVFAWSEIHVRRLVFRADVAPILIEAFESVRVAVLLRDPEIELRELEG